MSVLVGCPKKKGDGVDGGADAEAGAGDAAQANAAPSVPDATNAAAVARFPDETPIDHAAATLAWASNVARKEPGGEIVATLPKGTAVLQIAGHEKYVLVTFDNPKTAGERLMGWVSKDEFTAPGVVVKGDGGALAIADAGTSPGPAPVAVDAGPAPVAPKDAGGGAAPSGGAFIVNPLAGGACPAGYKISHPDEKCHHGCTPGKDGDCAAFGAGVFCTRGGYCKMR